MPNFSSVLTTCHVKVGSCWRYPGFRHSTYSTEHLPHSTCQVPGGKENLVCHFLKALEEELGVSRQKLAIVTEGVIRFWMVICSKSEG